MKTNLVFGIVCISIGIIEIILLTFLTVSKSDLLMILALVLVLVGFSYLGVWFKERLRKTKNMLYGKPHEIFLILRTEYSE